MDEFDDNAGTVNDGLTDTQVQVSVLVSIPPALLSLMGSSIILYLILSSRNGKKKQLGDESFKRILFGISVVDILSSINFLLQFFLLPPEVTGTSGFLKTMGNDQSCTASGFLMQMGMGAGILYFGMLSLYFVLKIRFRVTPRRMASLYEPGMHLVSICWPLTGAIAATVLQMYGPYPIVGCWYVAAPECDGAEDVNVKNVQRLMRCNPEFFGSLFTIIPWIFSLALIIVSNAMLYIHVRRTLQKTRNKTFAGAITAGRNLSPQSHHIEQSQPEEISSTISNNNNNNNNNSERVDVDGSSRRSSGNSSNTRSSSSSNNKNNTNNSRKFDFDGGSWRSLRASTYSKSNDNDPHSKKIRAVATQCYLYVAALFVTYIWCVVLAIATANQSYDKQDDAATSYYVLVLLERIFLPLGGFFNMMVYLRPRYMKCRDAFPNETRWRATRRALFGVD